MIGGDLAYTRDCTAFIAGWRSPEGLILLDDPVILEPPGDGSSIDVEDMVAACHEYAERYPGCAFSFDEMAGGQQLLQRLEREIPDSEFISYPKQSSKLCGAAMNFAELVSTRKLRHPDHPKLTEHVLAAAARFVGERWRFAKAARQGQEDRRSDRGLDRRGAGGQRRAAAAQYLRDPRPCCRMSRFLPGRRPQNADRQPRRSVYEDKPAPEPEERWRFLGEIDPATGRSSVDVSKASGWRPVEEFWRW